MDIKSSFAADSYTLSLDETRVINYRVLTAVWVQLDLWYVFIRRACTMEESNTKHLPFSLLAKNLKK